MVDKQIGDHKDEMNNLLTPSSTSNTKSGVEVWLHSKPETPPSWVDQILEAEKRDIRSLALWQSCVAEFVGVFFLCIYTIGLGLNDKGEDGPGLLLISLGVGFFIYVIISALATVSGAHVNPAVTLGFAITGQCSIVRSVLYIVSQCAGALAGSLVLKLLLHEDRVGNLGIFVPPEKSSDLQVVAMEMFITGFLNFVVMAILDPGRSDMKGSIPHVVGVTVTANIMLAGGVSGGCMNPARATGPVIVMRTYEHLWMYWLGPMVGGLLGALLYDKCFSVSASLENCLPCAGKGQGQVESRLHNTTDP